METNTKLRKIKGLKRCRSLITFFRDHSVNIQEFDKWIERKFRMKFWTPMETSRKSFKRRRTLTTLSYRKKKARHSIH